jgi:hypothetical protein
MHSDARLQRFLEQVWVPGDLFHWYVGVTRIEPIG